MRNLSKLLLVAIAALAFLGMAASGASARNLEVSNSANGFRVTWNPLRFEAFGREGSCPVTLEGTFERSSILKATSSRVGRITGTNVGTCTKNTVTLLRETLPWEVNYASFTGTLPAISTVSINIIRASFKPNLEGIECLIQTRTEQPWGGIAIVGAGGRITGFRADESRGIETGGGFTCSLASPARFAGTANSITNRAGTAAVTIRLI